MGCTNMGAKTRTIRFLQWIVDPTKPPANLTLVIFLRVLTLTLINLTAANMAIAIIMRPWKLEGFGGDYLEIGVWTLCRVTPKFYDCYPNFYDETIDEYDQKWFHFWRWLMIAMIAVYMFTYLYVVQALIRRGNRELKPWKTASALCFFGALCLFISFVILYKKFEWEYMEEIFRWQIMGWNEETVDDPETWTETHGTAYIMAWVSMIMSIFCCYLCHYTRCQERLWIESLDDDGMSDDTGDSSNGSVHDIVKVVKVNDEERQIYFTPEKEKKIERKWSFPKSASSKILTSFTESGGTSPTASSSLNDEIDYTPVMIKSQRSQMENAVVKSQMSQMENTVIKSQMSQMEKEKKLEKKWSFPRSASSKIKRSNTESRDTSPTASSSLNDEIDYTAAAINSQISYVDNAVIKSQMSRMEKSDNVNVNFFV